MAYHYWVPGGCPTGVMVAKFRSGDELVMVIRGVKEIELAFEQDAQWEGYYGMEKLRDVLIGLIVDSARHAGVVQALIDKVKMTSREKPPPYARKIVQLQEQERPGDDGGAR